MGHLLHLMFRCDGDVMESDVFVGVFGGSKQGPSCEWHRFQELVSRALLQWGYSMKGKHAPQLIGH